MLVELTDKIWINPDLVIFVEVNESRVTLHTIRGFLTSVEAPSFEEAMSLRDRIVETLNQKSDSMNYELWSKGVRAGYELRR
jgi:hypothetical protein